MHDLVIFPAEFEGRELLNRDAVLRCCALENLLPLKGRSKDIIGPKCPLQKTVECTSEKMASLKVSVKRLAEQVGTQIIEN